MSGLKPPSYSVYKGKKNLEQERRFPGDRQTALGPEKRKGARVKMNKAKLEKKRKQKNSSKTCSSKINQHDGQETKEHCLSGAGTGQNWGQFCSIYYNSREVTTLI